MIRIAATADLHLGPEAAGRYRQQLDGIAERADVLLVAGDLTKRGTADEAAVVADELTDIGVPVVLVLGNHDYHSGQEDTVTKTIERAGITVLEGNGIVLDLDGARVGIAGSKGFGGGFAGACGTEFGEPEMKSFVQHSRMLATRLGDALEALDCDVRIALTHYAPVRETLQGEPLEIYPFLGSYLLAEAIDGAGCDLALHGHAHAGAEKGVTPAGIHVRNVALPVIKHAYNLYDIAPAMERAAANGIAERVG